MYEIPFSKMMQPRLGATWAYDGRNTVFVSYAKYNPAASSLPRAASWDRNLATTINAYFDANGNLFAHRPRRVVIGQAVRAGHDAADDQGSAVSARPRQFGDRWTGRALWPVPQAAATSGRTRTTPRGWPSTRRQVFRRRCTFPTSRDQTRADRRADRTYVIAELDGAFTKYYEATVEGGVPRRASVFFRGSYTWSHYYGNFDQDGSSTTNDANIFIGSSNIGDGAGRQLWNMKTATCTAIGRTCSRSTDRYMFDWHASAGAFLIAQSGHAVGGVELRSCTRASIGTSTSDTIRYAEPAGSRRTDGHSSWT